MRPWIKRYWRRLLVVPPILAGVAAMALAVQTRDAPERQPGLERVARVRYVPALEFAVVPRAVGYGTVEPARDWDAVAEIAGTISEKHSRLKRGAILPVGTLLLRIDPTDYQLAMLRASAELRGAEARLEELLRREDNLELTLSIERQSLAVSRRELERTRELRSRGASSVAAEDTQERAKLIIERRVQELENELMLLPAQTSAAEAEVAHYEARYDAAAIDLERTDVRAPFTIRVAEVMVERHQYVRAGDVLARADGIAAAEVPAQFPLHQMAPMIPADVQPGALASEAELSGIVERMGLTAVVRLNSGALHAEWPARVARLSDEVDPQTRTVGVIVAVDNPFQQAVPGVRPVLTKGMFVEVELRAPPLAPAVVIPRAALQAGDDGVPLVNIAGADDRLERRAVQVGLVRGGFATIAAGLAPGERIVVTDVVPAIDGLRLAPVHDEAAQARLVREATAQDAPPEEPGA